MPSITQPGGQAEILNQRAGRIDSSAGVVPACTNTNVAECANALTVRVRRANHTQNEPDQRHCPYGLAIHLIGPNDMWHTRAGQRGRELRPSKQHSSGEAIPRHPASSRYAAAQNRSHRFGALNLP